MANEWIPIVGALGGVAVGGGLTFLKDWVQYNRQKEDDRQKMRQNKMEELLFSLYDLDSNATDYSFEILRLRELKVSIADAFPTITEKNRELMQKAVKAKSLLVIYAPGLESKLVAIVSDLMNFTYDWREMITGMRSMDEMSKSGGEIGDRLDDVIREALAQIKKEFKIDSAHTN